MLAMIFGFYRFDHGLDKKIRPDQEANYQCEPILQRVGAAEVVFYNADSDCDNDAEESIQEPGVADNPKYHKASTPMPVIDSK